MADPRRKQRKSKRSWTRFERAYSGLAQGDLLTPEQKVKLREVEALGEVETWRNNLYQVTVNHGRCVLSDKEDFPALMWLSIRRILRCALPRDWRDLQRIKNEIAGPDREGVELFPAESRLNDEADQFHLWVFADASLRFPFGYVERRVHPPVDDEGRLPEGPGSQRPFEFDGFHKPIERCPVCARLPEHCTKDPETHRMGNDGEVATDQSEAPA